MKEEGFVNRIMKRCKGILQNLAAKRVERAENQLETHPTYHN